MIDPEKTFNPPCEPANNYGYLDWYISDNSKNSKRRDWILTKCPDGEFYAILCRSEDDDGEFDAGVMLPKKMTDILRKVAGV